KPLPTKFCIGDVVLDFGLDEDSPMHVIPDCKPMQPSSTHRVVKPRRLPTKFKDKPPPKPRKPIKKTLIKKTLRKPIGWDWLMETKFRPISPIPRSILDDLLDLPTSQDIVDIYMKAKRDSVPMSKAEWPICLVGGKHNVKTPPRAPIVVPEPEKEPKKEDVSKDTLDPAGEELFDWEEWDRKRHMESYANAREMDVDVSMGVLEIGPEEARALREWVRAEMLTEPLSDINDFDFLLNVAKDYPKRPDALYKILSPNTKRNFVRQFRKPFPPRVAIKVEPVDPNMPIYTVKKLIQPILEIKQEPMDYDEVPAPTVPIMSNVTVPFVKRELIEDGYKLPVEDYRPERPIILDVKDIGPVPPKPQDEAAIQDWLQKCSVTVSQQLQAIINAENRPMPKQSSTAPGAVDFETAISMEKLKAPSAANQANKRNPIPENGWQNSFRVRLEDFEDIIDQNMTEFRDPHAKKLRTKWDELFGCKSTENLRRSLILPPLPMPLDKCLSKIRILRRPTKRKVEDLRLRIEMRFCKMFCTLHLNRNIILKAAVSRLDNSVYSTDIDVIQKRFVATQIAWIWSNGTIMIINSRGPNMLAETQRELMFKLTGQINFKAAPAHKLLHLRLVSVAYYPWAIFLSQFSETYALGSEPLQSDMHYVYYVDKTMPGVAARVHESGMIHVFAMTTAEADKMLQKLYLITANNRK
ncbi:hypothetical protein KR074_005528, partial [Drosophila pseudoananassae]